MTVMSPPAVALPATLNVLSASSAEIPPDATVEQLEAIKEAWLEQAIEDGIPWSLWKIVSVLGEHRYYLGRDIWDFEWETPAVGRIRLRMMKSAEGFRPAERRFYTRTSVSAAVISHQEMPFVAHFVWLHPDGIEPRDEQLETGRCLFLPGLWTKKIAYHLGRAIEADRKRQEEIAEEKRQQLLAELLAGRIV